VVAHLVLAATAAISLIAFNPFKLTNFQGDFLKDKQIQMSQEARSDQRTSSAPIPSNLRSQIEYYFSDENLEKDSYLRSKMDTIGCCSVELIAGFKRVTDFAQGQGQDPESAVADAVSASTVLESLVSDGKLCIRRTGPYNYRDLTGGSVDFVSPNCTNHDGNPAEKVAQLAVKNAEPLNGKNFRRFSFPFGHLCRHIR
jgi:hypothetical protein